MGVATKDKISRSVSQGANIGKAAIEQNRIGANLNAQTDPLIFVADTVGQTR